MTPPLVGSGRNIATPFSMEKLEWFGYPMVKNFEDIRFDMIHERDRRTDGQTDRHRMTAIARLCIATHSKNKDNKQTNKAWQLVLFVVAGVCNLVRLI